MSSVSAPLTLPIFSACVRSIRLPTSALVVPTHFKVNPLLFAWRSVGNEEDCRTKRLRVGDTLKRRSAVRNRREGFGKYDLSKTSTLLALRKATAADTGTLLPYLQHDLSTGSYAKNRIICAPAVCRRRCVVVPATIARSSTSCALCTHTGGALKYCRNVVDRYPASINNGDRALFHKFCVERSVRSPGPLPQFRQVSRHT